MKIVVDTSVIISVITNEAHKTQLIQSTEDANLIAPFTLHWEIGNAFSAMFRRNRIDLTEALDALAEYKKIPIQFMDVPVEEALRLSHELNIYAYDAYFLVCARNAKAPLLSLDKALIKKAGEILIEALEVDT